ncbi:hypothetical protein MLD52_19830 [Puniceicoccaceae bacterium K14]|nr:hypothetical protein [Puniceicoccaceae bacterium K14]
MNNNPSPRYGVTFLVAMFVAQVPSLFGGTFDWIKIESFRATVVSGSKIQPIVTNISNPYCDWKNIDIVETDNTNSAEAHSSRRIQGSDTIIQNFIAAAYAQGIFDKTSSTKKALDTAGHSNKARNEYFETRSDEERRVSSKGNGLRAPRGARNNDSEGMIPERFGKNSHTATTTLFANQLPFNNPTFSLFYQRRDPNYSYISNGVSFANITNAVSISDEATTRGLLALSLMALASFARKRKK